jgi:hypothetical protein
MAEPANAADNPQSMEEPIRIFAETRRTLTVQIIETALIPPDQLRAYYEFDPELARSLVAETFNRQRTAFEALERQRAHDRAAEIEAAKNEFKLESQDQKADIEDRVTSRKIQYRGQTVAAVVTICGFIVVSIALFNTQSTAAIWLGCSMVVGLAGVFALGRLLPDRGLGGAPSSEPSSTDLDRPSGNATR